MRDVTTVPKYTQRKLQVLVLVSQIAAEESHEVGRRIASAGDIASEVPQRGNAPYPSKSANAMQALNIESK